MIAQSKEIMFFILISLFILITTPQQTQKLPQCTQTTYTQEQLLTLPLQCFQLNYKYQVHDGQKLARMIDQRVTAYRRILQHIQMDKIQAVKTTPVLKWAQNRQKIFVNFKLSHRPDSPPCSDVRFDYFNVTNVQNATGDFKINRYLNPDFSNSSSFSFQGLCFFTSQKLLFQLNLGFNASLTNLTIEKQGLGSYTLVGDKKVPELWIDPFSDELKASIWTQLREKYEKDMNEYFGMRQQRKQQQQKNKKRRKRKRPTSKKNEQTQKKSDQPQKNGEQGEMKTEKNEEL